MRDVFTGIWLTADDTKSKLPPYVSLLLWMAVAAVAMVLFAMVSSRWTPLGGRLRFVAERRWIVNSWIGAWVAIATGASGLLLEDLLPKEGGVDVVSARVAAVVLALELLVLGLLHRDELRQRFGTLFYVVALEPAFGDKHRENLARLQRLYLRLITIPLVPSSTNSYPSDTRKLADSLHTFVTSDDPATGFSVAPNLLWDLSLSVGSQADLRQVTDYVELDGGFSSWRPGKKAERQPSRDSPKVHLNPGPCSNGATGLVIHFADQGPTNLPSNWALSEVRELAVWAQDRPRKVRTQRSVTTGAARLDPDDAVAAVIDALTTAIHAHPNGCILIFARLSKTVALAAGHALAAAPKPLCGEPSCANPGCGDPWRQIWPARVVQEPGVNPSQWRKYDVFRIHPRQPELTLIEPFRRADAE